MDKFMKQILSEIKIPYDALLVKKGVPLTVHFYYRKWLRYYLDFCFKYHHEKSKKGRPHLSLVFFMQSSASCFPMNSLVPINFPISNRNCISSGKTKPLYTCRFLFSVNPRFGNKELSVTSLSCLPIVENRNVPFSLPYSFRKDIMPKSKAAIQQHARTANPQVNVPV